MFRSVFIILCMSPFFASSQRIVDLPLTKREINSALNNAFNKLVAGNPNPAEMANYVTLDPVNASFSIKSTIPLGKSIKEQLTTQSDVDWVENPDSGRISYLSFSVSGALIDKKYGILFTDSKLNSGISLAAQYNFGNNVNHFGFIQPVWEEIAQKRKALRRKYTNDLTAILDKNNFEAYQKSHYLMGLQKLSAEDKLKKKRFQLDLIQKTVDSLGTLISTRTTLADTLRTLEKEVTDLVLEMRNMQQTIDSIRPLSITEISGQESVLRAALLKKYKNDYDTLLYAIPFVKFRATWYTVVAEYNRKSYNTFDITQPFSLQIKEGEKDNSYKLGFYINRLIQNKLSNKSIFLNVGIALVYKSNLDQLTASSVDQKKQFTNASGDTTRSVTTKYSVYADPVRSKGGVNLSGHAYYIFGKIPSGIHIFPSLDIQKHTVINCTFGYIIAFKNTAKDQPVINTELYIRLNDITNSADIDSKFYKRNEIGISFTLPFNIF